MYEQICECVLQGKEIDWFDLCREAGFSPQIVFDINEAKEKAKEALNEPLEQQLDKFGCVPVQCGHHVRRHVTSFSRPLSIWRPLWKPWCGSVV